GQKVPVVKKGTMQLPLHGGHAPRWLISRMERLAYAISKLLIDEHGQQEFLRRISDPLWFQAFGCVLGFDWHSSGLTTVVTGVLKRSLKPDRHGVMLAGGKGRRAVNAKHEIARICDSCFHFPASRIDELLYASRLSAKVDNAVVQDGYTLYHHAFLLAEDGSWAVVQQGMNPDDRTARRYHWLADSVASFVNEPHSGIISSLARGRALDMASGLSEECRKTCVDIANSNPGNVASSVQRLSARDSLDRWLASDADDDDRDGRRATGTPAKIEVYSMPKRLDWGLFRRIYDLKPRNYEELIAIRGVGPSTVRALALVAELVYGARPSWRDPVKFTFAHGGKDGVPYPVERKTYDKSIKILMDAVEGAEIERDLRLKALRNLCRYRDNLFT
ncbi:MAG: DUF763 domain-containing protein, partial [Nitrososphaerales archaeon]